MHNIFKKGEISEHQLARDRGRTFILQCIYI